VEFLNSLGTGLVAVRKIQALVRETALSRCKKTIKLGGDFLFPRLGLETVTTSLSEFDSMKLSYVLR
jgi:hypothetical protein